MYSFDVTNQQVKGCVNYFFKKWGEWFMKLKLIVMDTASFDLFDHVDQIVSNQAKPVREEISDHCDDYDFDDYDFSHAPELRPYARSQRRIFPARNR